MVIVIVSVSVSWGCWPGGDRRECQLVTCWLWVVGCGLGAAAWGLRDAACGLWAAACDLLVVGCGLWAAEAGPA